jgi:ribonucleoside-diphosphate reductase alpha chain
MDATHRQRFVTVCNNRVRGSARIDPAQVPIRKRTETGPNPSPNAAMHTSNEPSPFIVPAAVDAWDTWFRLRENGRLRDVSVEATWNRVARSLAGTARGADFCERVNDAQSCWQLVFDERILAGAGTRDFAWPSDPGAVVNAASFVRGAFGDAADLDFESLHQAAELACECLDNALLLTGMTQCEHADVRIGLVGVADALALLGKRYDSPGGRVLAGRIAQALAQGCFAASVRLARDRAGSAPHGEHAIAAARSRGMPAELLASAQATGVRRARCTAIDSHPRLALFANNVANALDPLDSGETDRSRHSQGPSRQIAACGYAAMLARRSGGAHLPTPVTGAGESKSTIAAQIALRGAVQPWIDVPIDYPFRAANVPDARSAARWQQLAAANRLGGVTVQSHR